MANVPIFAGFFLINQTVRPALKSLIKGLFAKVRAKMRGNTENIRITSFAVFIFLCVREGRFRIYLPSFS